MRGVSIYGRLRKLEETLQRARTGFDEDLTPADEETILAVAEEIRYKREIGGSDFMCAEHEAILEAAEEILSRRVPQLD